MCGVILQLDEEKGHDYHCHITMLKRFIQWKLNSSSRIDLTTAIHDTGIFYNKDLMNQFTNALWTEHIKNELTESDILDDIEAGILKINSSTSKALFPRSSSRKSDTETLNLLHGSSEKFGSFASRLGGTISNLCPICHSPDDAYHALFECPKYDSSYRNILPKSTDRKLFALKLLMSNTTTHINPLRKQCSIIWSS